MQGPEAGRVSVSRKGTEGAPWSGGSRRGMGWVFDRSLEFTPGAAGSFCVEAARLVCEQGVLRSQGWGWEEEGLSGLPDSPLPPFLSISTSNVNRL